jgi:outer membrane protein OmpA-like peptidoglycan-associated protein
VEPPAGGKPAGPTELKKSTELTLSEDTIYFLPDSSSLTPAAEAKLRTLVSMLVENPELEIEISGHCAPLGNEQGRVNLSFERARRVHDFLTASGWKPDITAKLNGAGSRKAVTHNPEMQHLNRRVEIIIISAAD